ncbi:MAG: phosphatidylserine decarboxylase [Fusobacteriaceae bacterium]
MEFREIKYIERKTGELKQEQVPGESFLKFLYYNPFGELSLNSVVKRKLLTAFYGRQMDSKKSVEKILDFVKNTGIDMSESKKTVGEFKSFNDFFIRELKEGMRPVDMNENALTSPADGKIFVYEDMDDLKKFFVKGDEFSLKEFLKDESLAEKYRGGVFMIVRLSPVDYHRFHFPAEGYISSSSLIKGYYYSVSTHAIRKNFRIYMENKREYSILKTENFGDILMSEIAATMVGGIEQSYKPNSFVKKGAEKGYFYFGGSTCILLFEKGKVQIDRDLLENSQKGIETKVYMGEKIGVSLRGENEK